MSIKLNKRQSLAAQLLAAGEPSKAVARQVGVRQETLSRWKKLTHFNYHIKHIHIEILESILAKQVEMLQLAHNTITTALNDSDLSLHARSSIALRLLGLFDGMHPLNQKIEEKENALRKKETANNGRPDIMYSIIQYLYHINGIDPSLSDNNYRLQVEKYLNDINRIIDEKLRSTSV